MFASRRSNSLVAGGGGGRRGPRAGRHDRDLELRQVPGDQSGYRGLAVVAADRPDAGAGPDHPDRDAQRGGPDRRRVHGRAGVGSRRVLRVRVAAGGGPPLTLVPAPPARRWPRRSRCSGWVWSGCPWPASTRKNMLQVDNVGGGDVFVFGRRVFTYCYVRLGHIGNTVTAPAITDVFGIITGDINGDGVVNNSEIGRCTWPVYTHNTRRRPT